MYILLKLHLKLARNVRRMLLKNFGTEIEIVRTFA